MAILGYKNSTRFIRTFGLEEWLRTRGLAGWLEIATDGLEASARERISTEIEAHYVEAVNSHMAEGESEQSAKSIALAELGDPQTALASFQQYDLTESEAKILRSIEKTGAKPFFSFYALPIDCLAFAALPLLFFLPDARYRLLSHWHIFTELMFLGYVGFRLIPRLIYTQSQPRRVRIREFALSFLVTTVAVAIGIASIYCRSCDGFGLFDGALVLYIYGYRFNPGVKIWKKLRKKDSEPNDPPPAVIS